MLIVEDDESIRKLIQVNLDREGFDVDTASEGREALALAQQRPPDIVLIDVMLPDLDGFSLLRQLRHQADFPAIFVTARGEEVDRIVGLEMGADDYIVKPFSPRELVARVRAVLRRQRGQGAGAGAGAAGGGDADTQGGDVIASGGLEIDLRRRQVSLDGREVELTYLEFELLTTMARRPGLVFSRDQLLVQVWGGPHYGDTRVVDVHIRNLRKKLGDDPSAPRYIDTVRGVGYRFKEPNKSQ